MCLLLPWVYWWFTVVLRCKVSDTSHSAGGKECGLGYSGECWFSSTRWVASPEVATPSLDTCSRGHHFSSLTLPWNFSGFVLLFYPVGPVLTFLCPSYIQVSIFSLNISSPWVPWKFAHGSSEFISTLLHSLSPSIFCFYFVCLFSTLSSHISAYSLFLLSYLYFSAYRSHLYISTSGCWEEWLPSHGKLGKTDFSMALWDWH